MNIASQIKGCRKPIIIAKNKQIDHKIQTKQKEQENHKNKGENESCRVKMDQYNT